MLMYEMCDVTGWLARNRETMMQTGSLSFAECQLVKVLVKRSELTFITLCKTFAV